MYDLKQASVLENPNLEKLLAIDGYIETKNIPVLWNYKAIPITFTLCVDDFDVKYVGKKHVDHLIKH